MNYAYMDFAAQQAFYREVADAHPAQQHFSVSEAEAAFDLIDIPNVSVVELGGWDGALACKLLARYPIGEWINYDIVGVPQVCQDERYANIVLADWFWKRDRLAGVFVATHTIEHITGAELRMLIDSLVVDYIYLEAPLTYEGQSWMGYVGSHILELGWKDVGELMRRRDYRLIHQGEDACLWAAA